MGGTLELLGDSDDENSAGPTLGAVLAGDAWLGPFEELKVGSTLACVVIVGAWLGPLEGGEDGIVDTSMLGSIVSVGRALGLSGPSFGRVEKDGAWLSNWDGDDDGTTDGTTLGFVVMIGRAFGISVLLGVFVGRELGSVLGCVTVLGKEVFDLDRDEVVPVG